MNKSKLLLAIPACMAMSVASIGQTHCIVTPEGDNIGICVYSTMPGGGTICEINPYVPEANNCGGQTGNPTPPPPPIPPAP